VGTCTQAAKRHVVVEEEDEDDAMAVQIERLRKAGE
jgi:hypothetical protein